MAAIAALVLAGCDRAPTTPAIDGPGARLEAAAVAQGMIPDPATSPLAGAWARGSDRMCVIGAEGGEQRIGVVVAYDEGQGCSASGTARRSGDRLDIDLRDGCRFAARFEGDRVVLPAEVPAACETKCAGRASIASVEVERQSGSASEARTLRGRDGEMLCTPS